jgi:hypothetical protein
VTTLRQIRKISSVTLILSLLVVLYFLSGSTATAIACVLNPIDEIVDTIDKSISTGQDQHSDIICLSEGEGFYNSAVEDKIITTKDVRFSCSPDLFGDWLIVSSDNIKSNDCLTFSVHVVCHENVCDLEILGADEAIKRRQVAEINKLIFSISLAIALISALIVIITTIKLHK